MNAGNSKSRGRIGPHSRTFSRGAIGNSIDGRSREGRFLRAFEAQLVQHIGGKPSIAERMLIGRLARVALRLELLDEKLSGGTLTEHDGRIYGAMHNSFRLMLRELGIKASASAQPRLADLLAAGRSAA